MNLNDLSQEYLAYKERAESDDPDDALDEGEEEEYAELCDLNIALDNALAHLRVAQSSQVVPDERDDLANYGMQFAETIDGFNDNHSLWWYVDFARYGEDMVSDFNYVEWDGQGYYVEVAW